MSRDPSLRTEDLDYVPLINNIGVITTSRGWWLFVGSFTCHESQWLNTFCILVLLL